MNRLVIALSLVLLFGLATGCQRAPDACLAEGLNEANADVVLAFDPALEPGEPMDIMLEVMGHPEVAGVNEFVSESVPRGEGALVRLQTRDRDQRRAHARDLRQIDGVISAQIGQCWVED